MVCVCLCVWPQAVHWPYYWLPQDDTNDKHPALHNSRHSVCITAASYSLTRPSFFSETPPPTLPSQTPHRLSPPALLLHYLTDPGTQIQPWIHCLVVEEACRQSNPPTLIARDAVVHFHQLPVRRLHEWFAVLLRVFLSSMNNLVVCLCCGGNNN